MIRTRTPAYIGLATLLAGLLTACGGGAAPAPKAAPAPAPAPAPAASAPVTPQGTLHLSFVGKELNLAGFLNQDDWLDQATGNRLASAKADLSGYSPELAESWEADATGTRWTFHLRKGVLWSDGKPFTAKDVVFSFARYMNPKVASPYGANLAGVVGYSDVKDGKSLVPDGIKALDDYTVQFQLTKPDALFMTYQAYLTIFAAHQLESTPVDQLNKLDLWSTSRVGTGPFILDKVVPGQRLELKANPKYFRGAPKAANLVYHVFQNAETMLAGLEKGDIDVGEIPVDELAHFQGVSSLTIVSRPSNTTRSIWSNQQRSVWTDPRVRQAISSAIDRDGIVKSLFRGFAVRSDAMFAFPWSISPQRIKYDYNPAKAKELLKAANWDSSKQYELIYYYADKQTATAMAAVQQQLADVGIKVQPVFMDTPAFRKRVNEDKDFDLVYGAFALPLDPGQAALVYKCGLTPPKGNNRIDFCNKDLDALFDKGVTTSDAKAREQIYQQIDQFLNKELPWVYLWNPMVALGVNKRLKGVDQYLGPGGIPVDMHLEAWQAP